MNTLILFISIIHFTIVIGKIMIKFINFINN